MKFPPIIRETAHKHTILTLKTRASHIRFKQTVLDTGGGGLAMSNRFKLLMLAIFLFSAIGLSAQRSAASDYVWPGLDSLINLLITGDTAAVAEIRKFVSVNLKEGNQKKIEALNNYLIDRADKLSELQFSEFSNYLNHVSLWISKEKGLEKEMLDNELSLAYNHRFTDYPDSTLHYLRMVERHPLSIYNAQQKAILFNIKGILATDENRFLESIEWYQKALEEIKDKLEAGTIKENIGVLYFKLKNYRRAISYLQRAEIIFEKNSDTVKLARLYANLGIAYMRIDSLDKAADYHLRASFLASENSFGLARSLANLGNVLRRQGELAEAMAVIDSSLQICTNLDISYGVFVNLINKAHLLLDMKKPTETLSLLREALQFTFAEDLETKLEIYELSARAYESLGNLAVAFDFQKKYLALRNSLEREESDRIVTEWEENLLREQKDRELAALNIQLERTRQRQYIILFTSLMGLLLAVATAVILYLRKQKQELRTRLVEEESETLRLQLELKERELTSQSIHLQSISGFAEDISSKLGDLKEKLEGEKADELSKIIRDFENGIPEELWEDFRVRFEKVNDHFYQKLLEVCPELTPVEIKIASFLRLNLSSKEISKLTNRSAGTISNTRSALRKKLKLDEEDNLTAYLMSL
jgi:tetratricopeptide (TPR) repeat protein